MKQGIPDKMTLLMLDGRAHCVCWERGGYLGRLVIRRYGQSCLQVWQEHYSFVMEVCSQCDTAN